MCLFSSLAAEMCASTYASWMMATFSPVRIWIFANLWVSINWFNCSKRSIHCSAINFLQNKCAHLKIYTACDIISSHAHQQDSCCRPLNWGTECDMQNWFSTTISLSLTQLAVAHLLLHVYPGFIAGSQESWMGDWKWDEAYNNKHTVNIHIPCSRMASYRSALQRRHLGNAQQKGVTWPGPRKKELQWQSYYSGLLLLTTQ